MADNAKSRKRRAHQKAKAEKRRRMAAPGYSSTYARKIAGNPMPTSLYAAGGRYEDFRPFGARS